MAKKGLTTGGGRSKIGDVRDENSGVKTLKAQDIEGEKKLQKKWKKGVDKAKELRYTTKAVAENGSESTLKTI